MKAPKVRLYIRVRRTDGHHVYADPVWNRNKTLRSGFPLIDGNQECHREGVYYLRFLREGKRVWKAVGPDADAAIVAIQNVELELQSILLGRPTSGSVLDLAPVSVQTPTAPIGPLIEVVTSVSLTSAVECYVSQLRLFRSPKTVREAKRILDRFAKSLPDRDIQTVTREDLLNHMAFLQRGGLGLRTISNHVTRINALLRKHKIVDLLSREDKPQYDEREVEAYDRMSSVCCSRY